MAYGSPRIFVRLPKDEYNRLRQYARLIDRSLSEIVRDALEYYCELEDVPEYQPDLADGQLGLDDL